MDTSKVWAITALAISGLTCSLHLLLIALSAC